MNVPDIEPIDLPCAWTGNDLENRKRMLLRLWLSVPGSRPILPAYKEVFGGVEAGALRGGVPCQEGWWRDVTQFRKSRTGIHATQGLSW